MSLNVKLVGAGIAHAVFGTQQELFAAMARPQEHYESPTFRGEVFTRERLFAEYEERTRRAYLEDWADGGCNVSLVFLTSFSFRFTDQSREEAAFVRAVPAGTAYLIGTSNEFRDPLVHEFGHAFFSVDSEYRTGVRTIMDGACSEMRGKLATALRETGGYHPVVIPYDEEHATVLSRHSFLERAGITLNGECEKLERLFWDTAQRLNVEEYVRRTRP